MGRIIAGSLFARMPSEWSGLCISSIFRGRTDESVVQRPRLRSLQPTLRTSLRLCRDPFGGKFHVEHTARSRPVPRPTPGRNTLCKPPASFRTEFPSIRSALIPCDAVHRRPAERLTNFERQTGAPSALWIPRPAAAAQSFLMVPPVLIPWISTVGASTSHLAPKTKTACFT